MTSVYLAGNLNKSIHHRLMMKDEELVNIKKKLSVEIESLTVRLHEAESRLKNEVEKIKQKMAVTVHELEMSLKQAQGSNVQLQDTCKVQQTKIMELTAAYDDTSRDQHSSIETHFGLCHSQNLLLEKQLGVDISRFIIQ